VAKRTLTDRTVKALKPAKAGKRYDVSDSVVPGLAVRVTDSGQRTFVLIARFPGSKNPTRRALGDYGALTLEQARHNARHWLEMLRRGVDPKEEVEKKRAAELRRRQNIFAAVAEDFIRDKLSDERRGKDAERDIRREFIPRWGKLPVTEVTDAHVREVIKAVKDRGHSYMAHSLLTVARRLFSWAIDQRAYGLESSPCDRLKPKTLIGEKRPRQRVLNDDELAALWRASERINYPFGPLYRLLTVTGQRKSEVAGAIWSEFDLGKKLWVIPAERMKADAAHVVPLTDDAIEILRSLPRFTKGDHLFSTTFGVTHVTAFSKAKTRLDKMMAAELDGEIKPFVIHDVRRTMRTGLSALPVPDLVRELVIGHTKPGLHRVYDQHAYLAEKRHALELWAARLREIITSKRPAKVVALRGAAR
jgi:integrase